MAFSNEEMLRYSRHLTLPGFGMAGQQKLSAARILVVGAGGLGSPAALYLASAGVGTVGILDSDEVELSNLHRQILHGTEWVGKPKVESAAARLKSANPHVNVIKHHERLSAANAMRIFRGYDIVLDASDNFPTRYLVCDASYLLRKPLVYGAIFRFEGHASLFIPGKGPCYRCLHPEPPPAGSVPSGAEAGILGVVPGLIGVIQATEAIKLVVGAGESLNGRLLIYNAMDMKFHEVRLARDPRCPLCGDNPKIRELSEH
jgi:adenylyltransferase/sulfurtransferase